jgi:hypothetical protein
MPGNGEQVTDTPTQAPGGGEESASADAPSASDARKAPERPPVSPTLSAYFGPSAVAAAAFVKAVRTAKVRRFTDEDVAEASRLMPTNDPGGRRLCVLASQSKLPEAVERWVWTAAQARLKDLVPGDFTPLDLDAGTTFRSLHQHLSPWLGSSDKANRGRAEVLLRLGLNWLLAQRSLDPWTVLDHLRATLFKDKASAMRAVRKLIARTKRSELKDAAAVVGLAHEMVQAARVEQNADRRRQALFQSQLATANAEIIELRAKLGAALDERESLSRKLVETQRQFDESQQHWGHDMVEVKSEQSLLLRERLKPLLSDAIDALEIKPPAPEIALERVMVALSSIEEAVR